MSNVKIAVKKVDCIFAVRIDKATNTYERTLVGLCATKAVTDQYVKDYLEDKKYMIWRVVPENSHPMYITKKVGLTYNENLKWLSTPVSDQEYEEFKSKYSYPVHRQKNTIDKGIIVVKKVPFNFEKEKINVPSALAA